MNEHREAFIAYAKNQAYLTDAEIKQLEADFRQLSKKYDVSYRSLAILFSQLSYAIVAEKAQEAGR